MKTNPYLVFNGNCREAFAFYEQLFAGTIEACSTFAGTPAEAHVPPDWKDKILHVALRFGDNVLMGSDAGGEYFEPMQGMSVTIVLDDPQEAERIFTALAEGGTVKMPFAETFWARGFGMATDRFGTPWIVNCEAAG
jgi:PhnB protein